MNNSATGLSVLREPEVHAKLVAQQLYPIGMCGDAFGALIRKRYDEYGRAVRGSNIKGK
jgi:hypothetical protein